MSRSDEKNIGSLSARPAAIAFIVFIVIILLNSLDSYPRLPNQLEDDPPVAHNCRFWAGISRYMPPALVYTDLIYAPQSLKHLSVDTYIDGWGTSYYRALGDSSVIRRGAPKAYSDVNYDSSVLAMSTLYPHIIISHIRRCVTNCCCEGCFTIRDPHPFRRFKDGRYWTFAHNGNVSNSMLTILIGQQYLDQNPPDGSGLPECDPDNPGNIIDSELFFLYLLKNIEENSWHTVRALKSALVTLQSVDNSARLNFALSDGYTLWSYCFRHTLFVKNDSINDIYLVASQYPSQDSGLWRTVADYSLVTMNPSRPASIIDVRQTYSPSIVCPSDTVVDFVPFQTVDIPGFEIFDPDDNIDTVFANRGSFHGDTLRFAPSEGLNTITARVRDRNNRVDLCNCRVWANPIDPGTLTGKVHDRDYSPVPYARVSIDSSALFAITNADGSFVIDSVYPGIYSVSITSGQSIDTLLGGIVVASKETTSLQIGVVLACDFIPGDINGNSQVNGLDAIYAVNYFKGGGTEPYNTCYCPPWPYPSYPAADVNGNCVFNGIDIIYMIRYLQGGPALRVCPQCRPYNQ